MKDLDSLLTLAKTAAFDGGQVLMRYLQEGVATRSKAGAAYDLVSDADIEAEQEIAKRLRSETPAYDLLGEEALEGAVDAEHLWIIDPLDGTNNYLHGLPHFAVSIAYYHMGRAKVGVVYNPARDDWYTAVAGEGAYYNGKRAAVSTAETLGESMVGCGFYYDRGEMMRRTLAAIEELFEAKIHGIRRFGTAALDLCQVGCGQFDAFFEYQLAPWDFAAGRLFVEEAGGRITDARGGEIPLAKTSMIASNGAIHQAVEEITRKHHP